MNAWNQSTRNEDRSEDRPPYSRVFVVCSKQLREENLQKEFEKFGHVEDLHIPRDRNTGESRGVAYIKYGKTSSAAAAIENLHMTTLADASKPIKVMIASNNKHDNQNNINHDKYRRLFIKVHRDITESEIKEHFSKFGEVDSVRLQKDKTTDECKGFAYVYYKTFLEAAIAYEKCDRKYKAIFATPKDELKRGRYGSDNYEMYSSNPSFHRDKYHSDGFHNSRYHNEPHQQRDDLTRESPGLLLKTKPQDYDSIIVTCSPPVTINYLESLCNIIPGMIRCKYSLDQYNGYCKAKVTYDSQRAAAHAVERLHNFEFPSGQIITVKPDDNPLSKAASNLSSIVNNIKNAVDGNPELLELADAIAQASTLIKAASTGKDLQMDSQEHHCSVNLPPVQPMASENSRVAQRCFLVFKPHPPPVSVLKDAFCRFGDLIDVSTFPNKTFGFAKYASVKSAQEAIKTLHGATLYGIKLKVLEADEKVPSDNKIKTEDNELDEGMDSRKRIRLNDRDIRHEDYIDSEMT